MTRRRRTRSRPTFSIRTIFWRLLVLVVAIPAFYLTVSVCLALVPVNRNWTEPDLGQAVYLISNGIHTDLILPVDAQGLDWRPFIPRADWAAVDPRQIARITSRQQPSRDQSHHHEQQRGQQQRLDQNRQDPPVGKV